MSLAASAAALHKKLPNPSKYDGGMTAIAFVLGLIIGAAIGFTIGATPPDPNRDLDE